MEEDGLALEMLFFHLDGDIRGVTKLPRKSLTSSDTTTRRPRTKTQTTQQGIDETETARCWNDSVVHVSSRATDERGAMTTWAKDCSRQKREKLQWRESWRRQ